MASTPENIPWLYPYKTPPIHANSAIRKTLKFLTSAAGPDARGATLTDASCSLTLPDLPYAEQPDSAKGREEESHDLSPLSLSPDAHPPEDLVRGLAALRDTPTLVMGVASDILFPAWQQREVANALRLAGNRNVAHVELSEEQSLFGHDTFLLDLKHVGGAVNNFLG